MGIVREKYTMADAIFSHTAQGNDINNVPGVDTKRYGEKASTKAITQNLKRVFGRCVNPIKRFVNRNGGNLALSSGFRCYALNSHPAIKGASKSKHLYGLAADIADGAGKFSTQELFRWAMYNLPEWNLMIWEYPEKGNSEIVNKDYVRVRSWLHIDIIPGSNKRQLALATKDSSIRNQYLTEDSKSKGAYKAGNYVYGLDFQQFNIFPEPDFPEITITSNYNQTTQNPG
jgi:hypothetical protein